MTALLTGSLKQSTAPIYSDSKNKYHWIQEGNEFGYLPLFQVLKTNIQILLFLAQVFRQNPRRPSLGFCAFAQHFEEEV